MASSEQSVEAERAGPSEASVFSCERKSEETAEDNLLCDRPPLVSNGICIRPNYLFSDKSFNYLSSSGLRSGLAKSYITDLDPHCITFKPTRSKNELVIFKPIMFG